MRAHPAFADRRAVPAKAALAVLSVAILAVAVTVATVAAVTRHRDTNRAAIGSGGAIGTGPTVLSGPTQPSPAPPMASDVASWNAIAPVAPRTSRLLPPITGPDAGDPTSYATAFVEELFTRDYASISREDLIAWVQAEDSPLRAPGYPETDWSKVLVTSLTDSRWDGADPTAVPTAATWDLLASGGARQAVSDVHITSNPDWEALVAGGFHSPDPMATGRIATFTLTLRTELGDQPVVAVSSASLQLELGSSAAHPGFGIAATDNFVVTAVS